MQAVFTYPHRDATWCREIKRTPESGTGMVPSWTVPKHDYSFLVMKMYKAPSSVGSVFLARGYSKQDGRNLTKPHGPAKSFKENCLGFNSTGHTAYPVEFDRALIDPVVPFSRRSSYRLSIKPLGSWLLSFGCSKYCATSIAVSARAPGKLESTLNWKRED